MKLVLNLNIKITEQELRKVLSFISSQIKNINLVENQIELILNEPIGEEEINEINRRINSYDKVSKKEKIIFENHIENLSYYNLETILSNDDFFEHSPGVFSLKNHALSLYEFIVQQINLFIKQLNPQKRKYPTLLPIKTLEKTGYIKNSPQYLIFCNEFKEDIDTLGNLYKTIHNESLYNQYKKPNHSLSPSACFHVYQEFENKILNENILLCFIQNVFRNEGILNDYQFGRFKDYTVFEVVMIGDEDYVIKQRTKILELTKSFLIEYDIPFRIVITADPFIIPKMEKMKTLQILEEAKYELQIKISDEEYIAVASFNIHGKSFTEPFNIRGCNKELFSGCVGFGLERILVSLLTIFGTDICEWPLLIHNFIKGEINEKNTR